MMLPVTCVVSGRVREYTLRNFDTDLLWTDREKVGRVKADVWRDRDYRQEAIQRARRNFRRVFAANEACRVEGLNPKPQFVTFTFAAEVTDLDECRAHWNRFLRKLRLSPLWHARSRYLAVPEIQWERAEKYGAEVWHVHAVFFGVPNLPRTFDLWRELWGQGRVYVKDVRPKRGFGMSLYLLKYLGKDMEADDRRMYWRGGDLEMPDYMPMVLMDLVNRMYEDDFRRGMKMHEYCYSHGPFSGKVVWYGD